MSGDPRHKLAVQFNSLCTRGTSLFAEGKFHEAAKCFQDAHTMKPKNAAVNANLGLALAELGTPDVGIGYLRKAIILDPSSSKYRVDLAQVLASQKQFTDALTVFEEALASTVVWRSDQLQNLWNARGLIENIVGLHDQALASFRTSLAHSKPERPDPAVLHNYARLLLKTNQAEASVPVFQELLLLDPDNPEPLCGLAIALTSSRKYNDALTLLDQGLKKWPNDPSLWLQHGIALRGVQRLTRAAGSFTKAADMDKQNELAWLMKGITLDDMRKHASGVEAYDALLKINPENKEAWCNRAVSFLQMNDPEEALISLQKALELDPSYHDAQANRAYALLLLGRHEDSLQAYDELIALRPDDATSVASKAIIFYNTQRFADAVRAIRDALVIDRNNEKAREIWPVIEAFADDNDTTKQNILL